MKYLDCFKFLAGRRGDAIVVTSAGNSGQAWWAATRDSERSFYLDASMSLSTMFASGLAAALPKKRVWAFMGDGAFCMNPGMLMVERQMNLSNLTHFLVSNRAYGATSNARLPNSTSNDYAAIARGCGLTRIHAFTSLAALARAFEATVPKTASGHTMVALEVEPCSAQQPTPEQPPVDGPEMKYRFARALERETGASIIGYRL